MPRRTDHLGLLGLLADSTGFVSGEALSRSLGVSRTAVWKQIGALRQKGHIIEAVSSKGYRFLGSPAPFDSDSLSCLLPSTIIEDFNFVFLNEATSTNTEAFQRADAASPEWTVVIADRQTAGKGRLGRQWVSPGGVNIYLSVVLRPELPPFEAPQLTFLSAVAVARAIEDTAALKPEIKWPNDVLIGGRKVAGLLNEMSAETDRVTFVILGIGVNINMLPQHFPEGLRTPPTSISIESGKSLSRLEFTSSLLTHLHAMYTDFKINGFDRIRHEWSCRCNAYGKKVRVDSGAAVISGDFLGIDHDGAMLTRLENGNVERIMSGDVTVI